MKPAAITDRLAIDADNAWAKECERRMSEGPLNIVAMARSALGLDA